MKAAASGHRGRSLAVRAACLVMLAAAASCTPASPSAWSASPFSLVAGEYTLVIYVPKGNTGIQVICIEDNDVPDTVSLPVTVTAIASGWQVVPVASANLGFQALLQMTDPTMLYGPVLGQARDPNTGVVVTIAPGLDPYSATQGDAMFQGTMSSRTFAAGSVSGSVQFVLGGRARSCSPNRWVLHPR